MHLTVMDLRVGGFIPDAALRPREGKTSVFLGIHRDCPECSAYVQALQTIRTEFEVWDAELVVLQRADAFLAITDRYGQVFFTASGHAWPAVREIEEWLKFLGTLCPE